MLADHLTPSPTRHLVAIRLCWRQLAVAMLIACLLAGPARPAFGQDQPTSPLLESPTPVAIALDPDRPAAERLAAATEVLRQAESDDQAIEQLAAALNEPTPEPVRRTLLRAMATVHSPPPALRKPMVDLLPRLDPIHARLYAVALTPYLDDAMRSDLRDLASDAEAPVAHRRIAMLALGHHREPATAEFLVGWLRDDVPAAVRDAACEALAVMTGLTEIGGDHLRWRQWWQEHKSLHRRHWQTMIQRSLARGHAHLAEQLADRTTRLVEAQRQNYHRTSEADRDAMLLKLLNDPLPPLRVLGINLIEQRLIDGAPPSEPLRVALRRRLSDGEVEVRREAAQVLWDASDGPAADIAAARLVGELEDSPAVIELYLRMLARLPRIEAVQPIVALLREPALRREASMALAEAISRGLVSDAQRRKVAWVLRDQLAEADRPTPEMVTLLGRIATEQDWRRIAEWVGSEDEAVRVAAARAWADSTRPVTELIQRVNDPVLQRIAISAATRRGASDDALLALVHRKPDDQPTVDLWHLALISMAGRVSPQAVLQADQVLARRDGPHPVRRQMLSAAIEPLLNAHAADTTPETQGDGQPPLVLADLLLTRAALRLADNEPPTALADYQRLRELDLPLSDEQRRRLSRGVLQARLATGSLDTAVEAAKALLSPREQRRGDTVDFVVEQFLRLAQRRAVAGDVQAVADVRATLSKLLDDDLPEQALRRLEDLAADARNRAAEDRNGTGAPRGSTPASETPATVSEPADADEAATEPAADSPEAPDAP